jgi:hypothetical protein
MENGVEITKLLQGEGTVALTYKWRDTQYI